MKKQSFRKGLNKVDRAARGTGDVKVGQQLHVGMQTPAVHTEEGDPSHTRPFFLGTTGAIWPGWLSPGVCCPGS